MLAKKVRITETQSGGNKKFQVSCDFRDMEFPDEAKVFVEPYFKSSFKRFDFGTVARFSPPDVLDISDLPTSDHVRYRIKIVDAKNTNGLILGFADVSGELLNGNNGSKQSILPVDFMDLGKRVWTLEFRPTGPVLAANEKIDNVREIVKSNNAFFSLVYPEVIKRIAAEIVKSPDFDEDDLSGWQADWMRFFRQVLFQTQLITRNADDETKEDWCNDIADSFARKYSAFEKFNEQKLS